MSAKAAHRSPEQRLRETKRFLKMKNSGMLVKDIASKAGRNRSVVGRDMMLLEKIGEDEFLKHSQDAEKRMKEGYKKKKKRTRRRTGTGKHYARNSKEIYNDDFRGQKLFNQLMGINL